MQSRENLEITGRVVSKTWSAQGSPLVYQVRLRGEGQVIGVKWLGRDEVPGVDLGVKMRVSGIPICQAGRRVLVNPDYQLLKETR